MENKINVAELLKDCPAGMELDCTMFENVTFEGIKQGEYPITVKIKKPSVYLTLTKNGCWNSYNSAKCVIFPKGETTWEGFHKPFEDGDVVTGENCACDYIAIFRKFIDDTSFSHHACLTGFGKFKIDDISDNANLRFATKEEKQKLFDAIKEHGHRWNSEIKTLVKLVQPKFKIGNVIQDIDAYRVKITEVNIEDECYEYESIFAKGIGSIPFSEQDNWKLVPDVKPIFKVGDNITKIDGSRKGEIFYIDVDKYHVAVSNNIGIDVFFEDQDDWELVPDKFDITTLKTFDKVLVRQSVHGIWGIDFFGFYNYDEGYYYTTSNCAYTQCIPYEQNKHLLGTTKDCDEYFKIW